MNGQCGYHKEQTMNNQIAELMRSRGLHKHISEDCQHRMEMLAELIVRECMDVVDTGENQLIARFQARQWLAEHFGIKE